MWVTPPSWIVDELNCRLVKHVLNSCLLAVVDEPWDNLVVPFMMIVERDRESPPVIGPLQQTECNRSTAVSPLREIVDRATSAAAANSVVDREECLDDPLCSWLPKNSPHTTVTSEGTPHPCK